MNTQQAILLDKVRMFLYQKICERIGTPSLDISYDTNLLELGLQSVDVVLLSGELEDHFGIEIDPMIMFECRTIDTIADKIVTLFK